MAVDYKGRTALVTGASSGIGLEFAKRLAKRGSNLILVARREELLLKVAEELKDAFGVDVYCIALDLSKPGAGRKLLEVVEKRGYSVDILVNNAGFATNAKVSDENHERVQEEISLNVSTLVDLTILLLPGMLARDFGVIVNVASIAAFQPIPNMAVYGATKAFVLSFTEALWGELLGTKLKALALCPGGTATEFFDIAGMPSKSTSSFEKPCAVVTTALNELDKVKSAPSIVSGRRNRLMAKLVKFLPKKVVISVAGKMFEPAA